MAPTSSPEWRRFPFPDRTYEVRAPAEDCLVHQVRATGAVLWPGPTDIDFASRDSLELVAGGFSSDHTQGRYDAGLEPLILGELEAVWTQLQASQPSNGTGEPLAAPSEPEEEEPEDWPEPLDPVAYHGLLGEAVELLAPTTEADPSAILVSLLVAAGNLIGNGPHITLGNRPHSARLFAVLVGHPGVGRKGTAVCDAMRVLESIDETWWRNRLEGKVPSGEGLINLVRDPRLGVVKPKGKHAPPGPPGPPKEEVVDPGVEDKRLLVVNEEFGGTLKVMLREGSTVSDSLRSAWETGNLRVATKNEPLRATGAHVSLLGNITPAELRLRLTKEEIYDGFASRFLFVVCRRSKLIAAWRGLARPGLQAYRHALWEVRAFWKDRGAVELLPTEEAQAMWDRTYPALTDKARTGLAAFIEERAAAQVGRLALTYALVDRSLTLEPRHFTAALAVWQYAERSVQYLWGTVGAEPDEVDALRNWLGSEFARVREVMRTRVSVEFGRRHLSTSKLTALRDALVARGYIAVEAGSRGLHKPEIWRKG